MATKRTPRRRTEGCICRKIGRATRPAPVVVTPAPWSDRHLVIQGQPVWVACP
jgi:hypothetical protein